MATSISSASPQRQLISGSIRIFLAESLILPSGLITTAILTRVLGPTQYGWFTLAATAVAWIEWSIVAIFARASFLHVAGAKDWQPVATTLLRLRVAVSVGAAVALAAAAGPLANLFGAPELRHYLQLFAVDIPIAGAAQAHSNILIGLGAYRERAWPSAGRWVTRAALVALFAALGFSIEGAIWASIAASVAELLVARYFVRPAFAKPSSFPARKLWEQTLPLTLFALSMRLFDKMDLFFLKALGASSAQAGFYGGAQNLSIVLSLVALSLSPVLISTITRLLRDGEVAQAREVTRQTLRGVVLLAPFAAAVAAGSPEIVRLILGDAFIDASLPLSLLIFSALALVMVSTGTAILAAAGKANWTFYLVAPMVPIAAAGHLLVIPRFGIRGAALVTLMTALFAALATMVVIHRLWKVSPPLGTVARSAGISVAIFLATTWWPVTGLMVPLKLTIISLVIAAGFALLGELRHDEWRSARALLLLN